MIQKMLKNAKKSKKAKRKDILTFALKRLEKELNTMVGLLPPMSPNQVIFLGT